MNREDFSKLIEDQYAKNAEIINTIRTHHGDELADRVNAFELFISYELQLTSNLAHTMKFATAMLEEQDVAKAAMAYTLLLKRGEQVHQILWGAMFNEDERKLVGPFMNQLASNLTTLAEKAYG